MSIDYQLLGEQLDTLCEVETLLGEMDSPYQEHVTGLCNLLGEMLSEHDPPD